MLTSFELLLILPALIAGSFIGSILIFILAGVNPEKILANITIKFLLSLFLPLGFSTSILLTTKSPITFYNRQVINLIKVVSSINFVVVIILSIELIGQKYFPLVIGLLFIIFIFFVIVIIDIWKKNTNGYEIFIFVFLAVLLNVIGAINNLAIKSANLFGIGSVENLLTGVFIVFVFFLVLMILGSKNFDSRYFFILVSIGLCLGPFHFLLNLVLAVFLELSIGLMVKIFGDELYKNLFSFTLFLYVGFLISVLSMLFS